jgi:hypothetical protein
MKKVNVTLIALQLCMSFYAQEFSTKFYIETAQGEKDTLELGYDPAATFGTDAIFDETDYGSPLSPDQFQAFVLAYDNRFEGPYYYLKKQIVVLGKWLEGNTIEIIYPEEALPITISWDKLQFEDPSISQSLITDWTLGGWFDAGNCTFKEYLKDTTFITVDDYRNIEYKDDNIYYYDNIPFRALYIAFGNEEYVKIEDISISGFNIYPNPVIDICYIRKGDKVIRGIRLFSISGKEIISLKGEITNIDCQGLSKGIYVLAIETKDNKKSYFKLIKK